VNDKTLRSAQVMSAIRDAGDVACVEASSYSPVCWVSEDPKCLPIPSAFAAKTPDQIRADLFGFASSCVDSALRFHGSASVDDLLAMLPGMIAFHLPSGAAKPPRVMKDELRLSQDLGLDSLALSEMAFKMDDLFGVPIEIREMGNVQTVADLEALLIRKFTEA
jgi:acyl carrier protein